MNYTHIHTLRHTPPFSQSAYTNLSYSKPQITWNNAFSVSNRNVKTLKLNKKIIRLTHPQPSVIYSSRCYGQQQK